MTTESRKDAIAAYKERKPVPGIYAVRCTASGEAWVGAAPDLTTVATRLWFTMRHGSHTTRALAAAWRAHGEPAFVFEELERLEPEAIVAVRDKTMRDRAAHWRALLGAVPI